MVGGPSEVAQARAVERKVRVPDIVALVKILCRGVERQTAAFEQADSTRPVAQFNGKRDACCAGADDAHVIVGSLAVWYMPRIDQHQLVLSSASWR